MLRPGRKARVCERSWENAPLTFLQAVPSTPRLGTIPRVVKVQIPGSTESVFLEIELKKPLFFPPKNIVRFAYALTHRKCTFKYVFILIVSE